MPSIYSTSSKFWRRGRDSNPRYPFGYAGFQDRSHQPLGHLSGYYSFTTALILWQEQRCQGRRLPNLETWETDTGSVISFRSVRIYQYLAGFAGFQTGHGLGKIFHRDAVGDHGVKIKTSAF